MQPFIRHRGIAAPLPLVNVDTDMVIPAKWLKTIKRTGLGHALFERLRYHEDGRENPEFILNREPYRQASILITGENFGCGSSREHAVWAKQSFGIRCLIGPSFADIFFNNSIKNGMLPIVLERSEVDILMHEAHTAEDPTFEVDLEYQTIRRPIGNEVLTFEVDPWHKHCLLNGHDDIGLTLQKASKIEDFEGRHRLRHPWLHHGAV